MAHVAVRWNFPVRCIVSWLALQTLGPVGTAQESAKRLPLGGLAAEVRVYFDDHGVPHIFATSWTDAARTLGYLHATDRLGQMDFYRRQASGTMAEIRGKEALGNDILMRQLGIRRGCEALWKSGDLPGGMRAELEAYADGV